MAKFTRRQILTHHRRQLAFAARCAGLVTLCHFASLAAYWVFVSRATQVVADQFGFDPTVSLAMTVARRSTLLRAMIWIYPANLILAFWFGLRFSHRFYGVLIPARRLIEDLGRGKFGGQINFRRGDELVELRDALNELRRRLAALPPGKDRRDEE